MIHSTYIYIKKIISLSILFITINFIPNEIVAQTDFEVQIFHLNSVYYSHDYQEGLIGITYTPGESGKYLSIGVQVDELGGLFDIVIDNIYLAPLEPPETQRTIYKRFNLSALREDGKIGHSFACYIHLFDFISIYPYDPSTFFTTVYVFDVFEMLNNAIGVESNDDHSSINITPVSPPNHTVGDPAKSLIHRKNVPNLDLDDSTHGDSDTYAGDFNACVPTATANSMKWLEEQYNDIQLPEGTSHRDVLEELSGHMNREKNEGTFLKGFISGVLDFIEQHKLPLEVKFQAFFHSQSIASTSGESVARNFNNPENPRPTWDFLKQQMRDGEDVEFNYTWLNEDDSTWYAHSVALSGINEFESGVKKIEIRHDMDQDNTGGTVAEVFEITIDNNGWMRFGENNENFIQTIVAESPKIEEGRETAAWLNEIFAKSGNMSNSLNNLKAVNEKFIEVVLHENVTDLENYKLEFYDGEDGSLYNKLSLDQFTVGSSSDGLIVYFYDFATDSLLLPNGGISISYTGSIIPNQFISYGGSFSATSGDAYGLTSADIGNLSNEFSISLSGIGSSYPHFTWQPSTNPSPGETNADQHLTTSSPSAPALVGPSDNSNEQPSEFDLVWNSTEFASSYSVEVAEDDQFGNKFFESNELNDSMVTVSGLSEGTLYYWRVNASNINGVSEYSETWSFTTLTSTGISDDNNLPTVYALEQNYPNPFNPSTTIRYCIPNESEVSLSVYNILGAEVYELFSGNSPAGIFGVTWNAAKFPSGIYFLRMSAVSINNNDHFSDTKKIILLK